ncbi:phage holin family protein [Nocardioides iriomotensis]|uniref:Phage holin family protein n=1 Tax=Nocardioides iriomotensis TaxID=715784 RepID=A0A4Q5J5H9_9ACTN|nr:phage holin family protein [Nocardioides iriomotensis]RYU13890.1 phage holin family protein [Nocardioides iriomotensis]
MSAPHDTDRETLGALVHDLSEQTSALVRSEVELAKAELTAKGKAAGVGAGMFGAAGILGLFGLGVLIATAILALALVLPAWGAALIVAVVLFAAAGIAAVVGKGKVSQATPPAPERAVEGVKQDVETIKGGHSR